MFKSFLLDLEYWFVKPIQNFHKKYKVGDLVEVKDRNSSYYGSGEMNRLALIVDGPFDRYDQRQDWEKRRTIKKCLYKVEFFDTYKVDKHRNNIFHFMYIKNIMDE